MIRKITKTSISTLGSTWGRELSFVRFRSFDCSVLGGNVWARQDFIDAVIDSLFGAVSAFNLPVTCCWLEFCYQHNLLLSFTSSGENFFESKVLSCREFVVDVEVFPLLMLFDVFCCSFWVNQCRWYSWVNVDGVKLVVIEKYAWCEGSRQVNWELISSANWKFILWLSWAGWTFLDQIAHHWRFDYLQLNDYAMHLQLLNSLWLH